MKKLFAYFACLCLLASVCLTCLAAGFTVKLEPTATEIAPGDSIIVMVVLSGAPEGTAGSLSIEVSDGLTVKSGKMIRSDSMMSAYDLSKNKGVVSFSKKSSLNGDYAEITVAAKEDASGAQKIAAIVSASPGKEAAKGELTINVSGEPIAASSENDGSSVSENGNDITVSVSSDLVREQTKNSDDAAETVGSVSNTKTLVIVGAALVAVALAGGVFAVLRGGKKKRTK